MRSRYPNPGSALEYYLWLFVRLSAALMLWQEPLAWPMPS
jgi:hypothetical protein